MILYHVNVLHLDLYKVLLQHTARPTQLRPATPPSNLLVDRNHFSDRAHISWAWTSEYTQNTHEVIWESLVIFLGKSGSKVEGLTLR